MRRAMGARSWGWTIAVTGFAVTGLVLAGCQDLGGPPPIGGGPYGYPPPPPPPPPQPRPEASGFNPQEFDAFVGSGPASLIGRVGYRSEAGERWTCAAQTIALIPATRYSGERMRVLYGSDAHAVAPAADVRARNAEQPGVDYGRYVRTAVCDVHDNFSFAHLPAGTYFLIARARPRGHAGGPNDGVVIMQRVDLAPGPTHVTAPQG